MKKIIIVLVILLLITSVSAFSLGIGLSTGLNVGQGMPSNLMLSAKFDQLPFLLGIAVDFDDPFFLGATADFWAFNENLTGPINFYAGPGLYTAIQGGDPAQISLGARVPLGLNVFLLNFFELFIEVAPTLGFLPEFNIPGSVGLQAAAGFRFWF
jgi:hypothetical protein